MSENHIIKIHLYPFDVMLSMGETDEELKKSLELCNLEFKKKDHGWKRESNAAYAFMFPMGQSLIRLRHKPETNIDFGHLQHEIFHVVTFITHRMGIKFTSSSDECYAYMIEYLTKEIYKIIWEPQNLSL